MNFWIPGHSVEVVREVDVVVAGAGPAGVAAALAARRSGARTLLVERYGFPGGVGTGSLVAGYASGFHDGERLVIGGLYARMRETLYRQGALVKTDNYEPFDPEALVLYCFRALTEAGVELRLHSLVTDAVTGGDGERLEAIIVESKSGRQAIRARTFVDATGDADLAARAGAGYEIGRPGDGLLQPVSLMFAMGGVDGAKLLREVKQAEGGPYDGHIAGMEHSLFEGEEERFRQAKANGYLMNVPRRNIAMCWSLPGRPDVAYANCTRILGVDGTNVEHLTRAEIEGRQQVDEAVRFFRDWMPGFENCYLQRVAAQVGIRESRRVQGRYVLTERDVLETRQFDDVVAQAHYMIDIHDPAGDGTRTERLRKGTSYDIPFRCLLPKKLDNLLVAGRCISATHEAFSSLRVMSIAMALGEAAGTAAAMAARGAGSTEDVRIGELQAELQAHGAILY
jgi:hypothetical protein